MLLAGAGVDPEQTDPEMLLEAWIAYLDEIGGPIEAEPVTVSAAAERLARDDPYLDADAVRQELLDRLHIRMMNAVVDEKRLARSLAIDLPEAGLRRRIECKDPMTLAEYAHVLHALANGVP